MWSCKLCGTKNENEQTHCKFCNTHISGPKFDEPKPPSSPVADPPPPTEQIDREVQKDPPADSPPAADYSLFLLIIPAAATVLAVFWIGNMNLLQNPVSKLNGLVAITILATAFLISVEANKVGMVYDRKKGIYSPIGWFFLVLIVWAIGYPYYLFKRKYYGLKNQLGIGILVTLLFIFVFLYLSHVIDTQRTRVIEQLQKISYKKYQRFNDIVAIKIK